MLESSILTRLERLSPLDEEGRAALAAVHQRMSQFEKDQVIAFAGEAPKHVHVLVRGWAARSQILPDGSRQITGFILPGEWCEHQTLVGPRLDHSISAITPVIAAALPHRALIEAIARHADLGRAFWANALLDEAIARAWIVNIGGQTALPRVGHLLMELFTRAQNAGLAYDHSCNLPLTQAEIGDAVGTSPVHVNRVLKELRGQGLIQLQGRKLVLRNVEALKELANFNPAYLRPLDTDFTKRVGVPELAMRARA